MRLTLLPEPDFPHYPDKCGNVEPEAKFLPKDGSPYRTRITLPMLTRALRGWLVPYAGSRLKPGSFHPIIAYLFTEWKCNLDGHYCWAFNNKTPGMRVDVARKDFWIHVPTNGRRTRHDVTDRLADAGAATFNLAVDPVKLRRASDQRLPKSIAERVGKCYHRRHADTGFRDPCGVVPALPLHRRAFRSGNVVQSLG